MFDPYPPGKPAVTIMLDRNLINSSYVSSTWNSSRWNHVHNDLHCTTAAFCVLYICDSVYQLNKVEVSYLKLDKIKAILFPYIMSRLYDQDWSMYYY